MTPGFLLTDYARQKGCSCKVPQAELLALLRSMNEGKAHHSNVGMDCSIVPLPHISPTTFLISTTDFFTPSVEDAHVQGGIAAANVLSDLYAMGVVDCTSMLMLVGSCTEMEDDDRIASTAGMMKGFAEAAQNGGGVAVTGGHTIQNPTPLIGGVAMAVVDRSQIVMPDGLTIGDVLVLTKPLGTSVAVNAQQWRKRPSRFWEQIKNRVSETSIQDLYDDAVSSMLRLNRNAARLMHKHGATSCTDITGFGLVGHAENLADAQKTPTAIKIDQIPVFGTAASISRLIDDRLKLLRGRGAETSGGLLASFPTLERAEAFLEELRAADSVPYGWVIGSAIARRVAAVELDNAQVVEV